MNRPKRAVASAAVLAALAAAAALGGRWSVRGRERFTRREAAPATGRFVKADDVELFVQESGPASGPAVVFLHGAAGWSETWRSAMTAGAARGFHCVAMDLPPLGYSERPADADYSMPRQAKRIVALLDALHLNRIVLVGHSFGGRVAVETALIAPDRIQKLVLVDPALSLPGAGPERKPSPAIRALLYSRRLRLVLSAFVLTNPLMTRRLVTLFIADPEIATPERVAVYQRPLSLEGTTHSSADWLPTLLTTVGHPLGADPASYARLTMPVLLIWGEKDATTPLQQGKDLLKLLPSARLDVIPGVGHLAPLEAPAPFQEMLFGFLSGPVTGTSNIPL